MGFHSVQYSWLTHTRSSACMLLKPSTGTGLSHVEKSSIIILQSITISFDPSVPTIFNNKRHSVVFSMNFGQKGLIIERFENIGLSKLTFDLI